MKRTKKIAEKWKKLPSLTKFLVFSFSALIIYTIVEMIVSTITGVSHDTLTTSFFLAFGGAETLGVTVLKVFKIQGENNNGLDD